MSTHGVRRLFQILLVLGLGAWLQATSVGARSFDCPSQECGFCPASWSGECWDFSQLGCEAYECSHIGYCYDNPFGLPENVCDCAPCAN